jgi:RHS repeat-associated protein
VPTYFTIQPGGGYIDSHSLAKAWLVYPNYTHRAPGARGEFWHYDPEGRGWYIYGAGQVTADGKQVKPDPGVGIYEFTGAMFNSGNSPPPNGPPPGGGPGSNGPGSDCNGASGAGGGSGGASPTAGSSAEGDPVDTATGLFVYEHCDLTVTDTWPLKLTRSYRQSDTRSRAFGIGMTHDYEVFLYSALQYQEVDLILPAGGRVHYARISPGIGYVDAEFEHTATPTRFYRSRIKWNGGGWDLVLTDGTTYVFGELAPLQSMRDRYGNTLTLTRTPALSGNITRIDGPNGRYVELQYDAANHVTQAKDNIGRTVIYQYDLLGRMTRATYPDNSFNEYTWETCPGGISDACTRILSVKDGRGNIAITNEYDPTSGRVTKQTYADSTTNLFAYTLDAGGKVVQSDVTDHRGNVRRLVFDPSGYVTSDTYALGKPEQQVFAFARISGGLVTDVTDPLGRVKHTSYDPLGNVASVTYLYGTPNAVTTAYTYEPKFQQVATMTDPLGHVTTYGYDAAGYLTSVTDALNHTTNLINNAAGQPTQVSDGLNHATAFVYDRGDLVQITDALSRVTKRYTDGAGRPVAVTDPLGNVTRTEYDAINRVLKQTDPLGQQTIYAYDLNGNLLTHQDPRGGTTQYTYDVLNRVKTRQDPLLKTESFDYDTAGNLVRFTDRKGQVTGYNYDALNRKTQAGFGATVAAPTAYTSTIGYTYDTGNRVRSLVDSTNGTISRDYDGLDRLTQEINPQGTVNYTYDSASRRATMSVAGQPSAINYTFDNANRLTNVVQGTQTVIIGYDNANRRTSLTLPNGIVLTYGYDNANQLTSLTYKKGTTTLGTLTHTYDLAGRRITQDGTYARTTVPSALSGISYNAHNELTSQGATNYIYDFNGNLTHDGVKTYVWNERNQLASISGGVTASFQYDAAGRRLAKTVSGATTKFLYDGIDPIQELNGTNTPTANLLTGLGVDEIFSRTHALGTETVLRDALGSTLALSDSTGTVNTSYTYEPYGKTTKSGAATTNSFGYTGREDDGTGLYYYRARYYHPGLSRFISEDPLGIAAGPNSYAYVGGSPARYTDPLGLGPWDKLYGLPKQFWRWLHREDNGKLLKELKDTNTGQITKETAEQWHEIWKSQQGKDQRGFIDPSIGEILIPWWAFSPGTGGCDENGRCQDMVQWPPQPPPPCP